MEKNEFSILEAVVGLVLVWLGCGSGSPIWFVELNRGEVEAFFHRFMYT